MMQWLWAWWRGEAAPEQVTCWGQPAEEGAHLVHDHEPVVVRPPTIPAVALWETFQFNAVDAEDAFVGRVIRVVGTVERVEKRGEDYVLALARLRGTERIVEVTFRREDRDELRGVRPGDSVVATGRVDSACDGRDSRPGQAQSDWTGSVGEGRVTSLVFGVLSDSWSARMPAARSAPDRVKDHAPCDSAVALRAVASLPGLSDGGTPGRDRLHDQDRESPLLIPPISPRPPGTGPTMSELTAIDLFAGAGGFSLGLRRAGFDVVLANEFSVDPEWTYRHNLAPSELALPRPPEGAVGYTIREHRLTVRDQILKHRESGRDGYDGTMRGGDIAVALTDEWLQGWVERRQGKGVDVLVAGPPCQGFSSAGRQDDDDARNQLVFEAVRVINVVKPKVVVIENVPGMLARHCGLLLEVGRRLSLSDPGYLIAAELLHGHLMGVPQTRKRLVLVGVRRDLIEESGHARLRERIFPVGCPVGGVARCAVADGETLLSKDIIGDLGTSPPVFDSSCEPASYREAAGDNEFRLEMRASRASYLSAAFDDELVASCWNHEASVHSEIVRKRMRMLREVADRDDACREQRCSSRWLRKHFIKEHPDLDTKKAAQRVLLSARWPGLTVTSLPDDIVHFEEDRIPTVREVARLQTFPDWFEFKGVRTTGFERRRAGIYVPQYTQVANAVPPRLAHAVAARIRAFLLLLASDPSCSWAGGHGLDRLYDVNVNRPASTARKALDYINETLQMEGRQTLDSGVSTILPSEGTVSQIS